jgi:antitoxin VapB
MALYLKDAETDGLARQIARLTGETLTQAVRIALAERLQRERQKRGQAVTVNDLADLFRDFDALPVLDNRTADEILGYDDNGLPT